MVNQNTYNVKSISCYNFDILDFDDENDNNLTEQQLWNRIKEEFSFDYKFNNLVNSLEEEIEVTEQTLFINDNTTNIDNEICQEQVLSQRLSQLSTIDHYESEPSVVVGKRRRLSLILTTLEPIAKRLRTTTTTTTNNINSRKDDSTYDSLLINNKLFDQMIKKINMNISSSDIDRIRQIAFFLHKINHLNLLHKLWSVYLQYGTGQINFDINDDDDVQEIDNIMIDVNRRYWPQEVVSEMVTQTNITEEQLVQQHLHDYEKSMNDYQIKMNDIKSHLNCWSLEMEQAIQTFVCQYSTTSLQMKYDAKIFLLKYQYKDEILQRKYQQLQPTDYQKQIAKQLYALEINLETAKSRLIQFQKRVIYNKPPIYYDCLQISLPSTINTISNLDVRQQLLNRYINLIQQTKTDLMTIDLVGKQALIYEYQTRFDQIKKTMKENNDQHIQDKEMTSSLISLIHQRSLNMKKKIQEKSNIIINYSIQNSYDQLQYFEKSEDKMNFKRLGFLPNLIIDPTITNITSHLTDQQIKILNRGPTYIAPGQLHISLSFQTLDQMVMKQYVAFRHQLRTLFDKYHIILSTSSKIQNEVHTNMKNIFSIPLPDDIYQRAIYESKLIQTIYQSLKKNNLILRRTADQNNLFYLGNKNDFINLSNQYMENNTDYYRILYDINQMTVEEIQEQLKIKYQLINCELEKLFNKNKNNEYLYRKLRIHMEHIKIPYLYFLPDISTEKSIQVEPMIIAHHSATSKIAEYLTQLLRPVTARHIYERLYINEADFIQKLLAYTEKERNLQPTTLFVKINITNFHTMTLHQTMSTTVFNFLNKSLASSKIIYTSNISTKTQTISFNTIQKLIELYLENNIFYYNNKIYEFIQGSPNSLLISEMLANIYLHDYESILYDDPRLKTELYGRYKDQIFFTWNRSKEELQTLLRTMNQKQSNIHIEASFGRSIHFLNAQIENRNGHLYTSVYHDKTQISKYVLPYVVGQTKAQHSHWFRSALIRAIRFCSNYIDFIEEQSYLQMTCLANGYSIDFIEIQLKHLYIRFNAENIRFCLDQIVYQQLRRRILNFIDEQRIIYNKNEELEDQEYIFYLSYPYDYGSYNEYNRKFHETWRTHLQFDGQLSHPNAKVILAPKQIYSLNTLFAEEKPSNELFKKS
ncbi:unnamed protein product [Adineta steineri]|uniref:Helix-turn-helix domain-containing protein n=1 Tax=Adineta steineri TaxID=433720 RepID=A0A815F0W6_9BILA|nr:unnamed protein product [Adineta steineri]CAF3554282.1 unnamed protein product [Adineta steineri]